MIFQLLFSKKIAYELPLQIHTTFPCKNQKKKKTTINFLLCIKPEDYPHSSSAPTKVVNTPFSFCEIFRHLNSFLFDKHELFFHINKSQSKIVT